jgi:IS5 family transposase
MFRALLLGHWYGMSDRELEDALYERLSFRRFLGLRLEDPTPDHTTLCRFRERLRAAGLSNKLLDLINGQIEAKGLMLKRGTMIDATIVETAAARPAGANDPRERVDPDAAFIKREGKPGAAYGYKAHVAADEGSLLIRQAKLTPANVTETEVADELIVATADAAAVYADKAYDTQARRALLHELGLEDRILRRGNRHHPLPAEAREHNIAASKIRRAVETVFAVFKRGYGYRRTRYFGLIRNQLELTLLAICFNLRRVATLCAQGRSPSPA